MSADNRTVATDALETLGFILDDSAKRDAIHLAVLPVIAGQELCPGINVKLVDGVAFAPDHKDAECVGIVDPFLGQNVLKGERFWLVVYPRQITSLRHVWEHPSIDQPAEMRTLKDLITSEQWLREFAKNNDVPGYDLMMKAATMELGRQSEQEHQVYGEDYYYIERAEDYITFGGVDAHAAIPSEFWDHVEIVTGKKVPSAERATYFSCSC